MAYQAGDTVNIDGIEITLSTWKGNYGLKWGWRIPSTDEASMAYWTSAAAAIDAARKAITGQRCPCGAPATMTASTVRTCADCYDRYTD